MAFDQLSELVPSDDSSTERPSNDDTKEEQEVAAYKRAQDEENERLAPSSMRCEGARNSIP